MDQRTLDPIDNASRHVSVSMIARLAIEHLTDEQLINLLTQLEHEFVTRTAQIDYLVAERSRTGRTDTCRLIAHPSVADS